MILAYTIVLTWTLWFPIWQMNYRPPMTSDKKDIGITQWDYAPDARMLGASWAYTWGPTMTLVNGVEIVPMVKNADDVGKALGGNSQWLLGFNEPELREQGNVTPEDAAIFWRQIEQGYPDKRLISPAVTLNEKWLDNFRDAYYWRYSRYPRLDALAAHCYQITAADCEVWMRRFIDKARIWGISQVWVTEFAFPGKPDEMEAFVQWMENEPMIARYAIYTAEELEGYRQGFALIENGRLNEMGMKYRSLP